MLEKIVVQFGNRTVKGSTDRDEWKVDTNAVLHSIPIQLEETGGFEELSLEGVKAVFFVKSFDSKSHEDLRFHDHLPHAECLWVRIIFKDDEVVEGLIHNSCEFVLDQGFFLSPIDFEANNWLVYTVKSQLKDFHVLGLRSAPKSLPHLGPSRLGGSKTG